MSRSIKKQDFLYGKGQWTCINPATFDKAKWHIEGDFPASLSGDQAYVHTGFYITWLIFNNLTSAEFNKDNKQYIEQLVRREIRSGKIYKDQLDGVFTSNELNVNGYQFTKAYFDFESGLFLKDYEEVLAHDLPSLYNVQDTWGNYDKISDRISERYAAYKAFV